MGISEETQLVPSHYSAVGNLYTLSPSRKAAVTIKHTPVRSKRWVGGSFWAQIQDLPGQTTGEQQAAIHGAAWSLSAPNSHELLSSLWDACLRGFCL